MWFTVIDTTTGKEPDLLELARTLWPTFWHLSYSANTYFLALSDEGNLLFLDSYGNWRELPASRFIVKMEGAASSSGMQRTE